MHLPPSVSRVAGALLVLLLLARATPGVGAPGDDDFKRGYAAFEQGRYEEALRSFHAAATRVPSNASFRIWLGVAFLRSGYAAEGRAELEEAAKLGRGTAVEARARQYLNTASPSQATRVDRIHQDPSTVASGPGDSTKPIDPNIHDFRPDVGDLRLIRRLGRWKPVPSLSRSGAPAIPGQSGGDASVLGCESDARAVASHVTAVLEKQLGLVVRVPIRVSYLAGGPEAADEVGWEGRASMPGWSHQIEIFVNFPKDAFAGNYAHEYAHCWYNETSAIATRADMFEGFSRWVEIKFLVAVGYYDRAREIESNVKGSHGASGSADRGYHILREVEARSGELGVMRYLYTGDEKGRLPKGVTLPD